MSRAPFCFKRFKLAPKAKPDFIFIPATSTSRAFTASFTAFEPPFKFEDIAARPSLPTVPPNIPY